MRVIPPELAQVGRGDRVSRSRHAARMFACAGLGTRTITLVVLVHVLGCTRGIARAYLPGFWFTCLVILFWHICLVHVSSSRDRSACPACVGCRRRVRAGAWGQTPTRLTQVGVPDQAWMVPVVGCRNVMENIVDDTVVPNEYSHRLFCLVSLRTLGWHG